MGEPSEVGFWGSALVPWPEDVVSRMGLSREDQEYLLEVGLPECAEWNLKFVAPTPGAQLEERDGMVVLGRDGPVPLCAAPGNSGVIAVEGNRRRLVNTSVRCLGAFLAIYQRYRLRVRGLDDAKASVVVDEAERGMRECDPAAMSDDEAYWPVVVEQMREGLL